MSLIIKKNTPFKIPRTPFRPSSLGGLALWLKADAGVTRGSFSYVSEIVISGTSNYNGTYTATSVPQLSSYGAIEDYSLSSPTGNTISFSFNTFYLVGSAFYSSNGQYWDPKSSITITGFDGDFISANGTYNDILDGNYQNENGYVIYGSELRSPDFATILAYSPSNWVIDGDMVLVNGTGAPINTMQGDRVDGVVTTSSAISNNVTAWADQSGNENNATPVADNPIYNISDLNSKPTISLTSMSDYVERVFTISSNPLGASGSTAFSVQYVEGVCNNGNDNGPIFGNFGGSEDSASLSQTHYPYGPDCFVYDAFGTRLRKDQITSPVTIANAWTLYSVKSTDDDWQSFVNGQLMHSDPTNTYSSAIGGDDTTLYIGKQTANGTFQLKGKVAEVIVYNRVLTTPERQQVEAYLNQKYAIY
jgi:hypothetical protein